MLPNTKLKFLRTTINKEKLIRITKRNEYTTIKIESKFPLRLP